MENRDNLYKAVNNMSSIKFGFNKDLIEYLSNEGYYLLKEELTESESLQQFIQLKVAEAYSDTPVYIPLQVD